MTVSRSYLNLIIWSLSDVFFFQQARVLRPTKTIASCLTAVDVSIVKLFVAVSDITDAVMALQAKRHALKPA